MKKYIDRAKSLVFSTTAKDTYVLFAGNLGSAFWGFLFTVFVSRALNRNDFGIFSATLNLVIILSSLADIGITSGLVNFVSKTTADGDEEGSYIYEKAGLVIRLVLISILSLTVIVFAPFISKTMLATHDPNVAIWAAIISFVLFVPMYFPSVLQAKRKFLKSIVVDNLFYVFRLIALFGFVYFGSFSLYNAFSTAIFGFIVSIIASFIFLGIKFLKAKPNINVYKELIKFSGWIGVNRIVSSVSGRLDIQMLASISGAAATALYSIPSRLSSFIIILTSSFSAVLAPRFASFNNKNEERKYLIKATFALIPIILIIILWVIFAKPFMYLVFPNYMDAVPIFQALTIALIPFVFTAPSVTAIIYAMHKNIYIGAFSFFQIAIIFLLNYYFIPSYGPFGPALTWGITNIILAVYTWIIVIKYYWYEN